MGEMGYGRDGILGGREDDEDEDWIGKIGKYKKKLEIEAARGEIDGFAKNQRR